MGMVSMGLIDMNYLLLRREQGRQWKTENQNDLLNVVLCDKPEFTTAAGATARDNVR